MRKWIAAALVLLALAAGAVALAAANLNSYLNANRDWISRQVEAALGRRVAFDEVELSLWGGLGVRVANLRVGDDPGFSREDFLEAREVRVNVGILPALRGRFDVSRVVVDSPAIALIRTGKGLNLASFGGGAAEEGEKKGEAGSGAGALLLGLLEIQDGEVRFVDRTTRPPRELVASRLDLAASDLSLEAPIGIRLDAAVLGADRENLRVEGRIGPLDRGEIARTPIELELSLEPADLAELARAAGPFPPELAAQGALALEASLEGSLERLVTRASLDASAAALAWGESFSKPKDVPLRLSLAGVYQGEELAIEQAELRLAKGALRASGKLGLAGRQAYDLVVEGDGIELADWKRLAPAVADLDLAGRLRARVRAVGALAQPGLPKLDGTAGLEELALRPEGGPALEGRAVQVTLRGNTLELPATPLSLDGSPVELEAKAQLGAGEPTLMAKLRSPEGRLRGFDYRNLAADLRYQGGRATIERLVARTLDGELQASGSYDRRDPGRPVFDLSTTLRDTRIERLVGGFAPGAARVLQGRLGGDVSLSGSGSDWNAIKQALTGNGKVRLEDAQLADVNLAEGVLSGATGVQGLSGLLSPKVRARYPSLFGTGKTEFDALDAKLAIAGGRVLAQDLRLAARDFAVLGDGGISLDGEVDLKGTFTASEALTVQLVEEVKQARLLTGDSGRLEVPFRLSGPASKLRVQPDANALARTLLGHGLAEGLRKLVPGAARPAAPAPQAGEPAPGAEGEPAPGAEAASPPVQKKPLDAEDLLRKGRDLLRGR